MNSYVIEVYHLGELWQRMEAIAADALAAINIIEQQIKEAGEVRNIEQWLTDEKGKPVAVTHLAGLNFLARRLNGQI